MTKQKQSKNNLALRIMAHTVIFLSVISTTKAATQPPVFNGGGTDEGLQQLEEVLPGTGVIDNPDIITVVLAWVKFGLTLLGLAAFVAFVWAGGLYILAFLNEEGAETAKKVMIWAAIGIIVILMSYALVNLFITATV